MTGRTEGATAICNTKKNGKNIFGLKCVIKLTELESWDYVLCQKQQNTKLIEINGW